MAAAQSWQAGLPAEVAAILGPDAELQVAIAEHKVPMPGKGYPSQCDVFALVHAGGRDMAVAVEAKVNEPFGPTLGAWLADPTANKTERIETICRWLGLPAAAVDLRYQLFHRTAAAIVEARRFRRPVAAMIVQSFSAERRWFDDFAMFCGALGLQLDDNGAAEKVLPDGLSLRMGWACGDPQYLEDKGT